MNGEWPLRDLARRSPHAARDLAAGQALAEGDLLALRPGTGISAERAAALLGRILRRPLAAGEMLTDADVA